jgi:hypothetical protein
MGVADAQKQSQTRDLEHDRLGTLEGVHNGAWNVLSVVSTARTMAAGAGRFAACLGGIAMLPLARAGPETGLMLPGATPSGNGLEQLWQNHPKAMVAALMTTAVVTCGTAYGLIRSSISAGSPSVDMSADNPLAELLESLGATTISACQNLTHEIEQLHSVDYDYSSLIPDLTKIDRMADEFSAMVKQEIDDGTHALSLESPRQCIDSELRSPALRTLRNRIENMRGRLTINALPSDFELELTRKKFNKAANIATKIDATLKRSSDLLADKIDSYHARNLPRLG